MKFFLLLFTVIAIIFITSIQYNSFQKRQTIQAKCNPFNYQKKEESKFKFKVRDIALEEWNYFGNQLIESGFIKNGRKETDEGFWQRVSIYWKEGTGFEKTGKDTSWPWSAAFISWVMKKAGSGDKFPYSIRHSDYINYSIQNREKGNCDAEFIGYQIYEYSPDIGDLVCYSRQENIDYQSRGRYKSHCDIVIEKTKNRIGVIGGNVRDSVTKKFLPLDSEGKLDDSTEHWFVVIKNNL